MTERGPAPRNSRVSPFERWDLARDWLWDELVSQQPSLRTRLLATLTFLLVALVVLEIGQHMAGLRSDRGFLAREYERVAAASATAFSGSLEQIYRLQATVADATLLGRMTDDQRVLYLHDVRERYPGMVAVELLAPGNRYFRAPIDGMVRPPGDRAYITRLSLQRPRHLARLSPAGAGTPNVLVASLVLGRGDVVLGIVAMEFTPDALQRLLPAPGPNHKAVLLDGRGTLVSPGTGLRRRFDDELRAQVRAAAENRRPLPLTGGGAAAPIPGTNWAVAYLPNERGLLLEGLRLTAGYIFYMCMVVLALALAVMAVVHLSLRPVTQLSAATKLLGSGDLSVRLPPAKVREFDGVVEAFNRMADQLQSARNELVEANQGLEAKVHERTRALEAEHEKLLRAERLSTLGLLSSAIAHDLRSPLNTVSLCVQYLQARGAGEADPKLAARIQTMDRELRRAEQIIHTLLAFARTGEPDRQPTDLHALVREVASIIYPPAAVRIDLDLDADARPVELDSGQLFQVLENLIRNAIQAMPEGGAVRVATRFEPEGVVLQVADSGPGIAEELRATIFEPLVTTKSTGTGLGLALCKRIVDAHGGEISVASEPGRGTAFTIRLPYDSPEAGIAPDPAGEPELEAQQVPQWAERDPISV